MVRKMTDFSQTGAQVRLRTCPLLIDCTPPRMISIAYAPPLIPKCDNGRDGWIEQDAGKWQRKKDEVNLDEERRIRTTPDEAMTSSPNGSTPWSRARRHRQSPIMTANVIPLTASPSCRGPPHQVGEAIQNGAERSELVIHLHPEKMVQVRRSRTRVGDASRATMQRLRACSTSMPTTINEPFPLQRP